MLRNSSRKVACGVVLSAVWMTSYARAEIREDKNEQGQTIRKSVHPVNGATEAARARRPPPGGGNGITYHGGPLITGTSHVYFIWYGAWSANSVGLLQNLAGTIGGSPYFNINTTYSVASPSQTILNSVTFGGAAVDNYSQGKSLSDSAVQAVVTNAFNKGSLMKDPNGVYFVLTSADVNETSGFCTQYCGWHTYGTIAGTNIKFAFVGNPDRCPSACEAQSTSPNANPGADGMASVIAHELEEAVTDPNLNAWYDSRGNENADKCAWTFGTTHAAPNGSQYNVTLGGIEYLIQRNWVNANGGLCAMNWP
jgi:hypothetical protein